MGARNRLGIGLSYRPARLHRLEEPIPWNRFLATLKLKIPSLYCGEYMCRVQLPPHIKRTTVSSSTLSQSHSHPPSNSWLLTNLQLHYDSFDNFLRHVGLCLTLWVYDYARLQMLMSSSNNHAKTTWETWATSRQLHQYRQRDNQGNRLGQTGVKTHRMAEWQA